MAGIIYNNSAIRSSSRWISIIYKNFSCHISSSGSFARDNQKHKDSKYGYLVQIVHRLSWSTGLP
uniref:Predicted protein n=1 Tax=Hordeum vulgare subsp. vulgare TaxID=112509 RepID=F2EK35_HORVV|nr:predicted protein [Hordeum vulgare subsp. vulgare]